MADHSVIDRAAAGKYAPQSEPKSGNGSRLIVGTAHGLMAVRA